MIDGLIRSSKILITAGSGGVGKTTLAASIAVKAALMGKRVLVITIDPAKRLAQALGMPSAPENLESLGPEVQTMESLSHKVFSDASGGELWACQVDPKNVFERVLRELVPETARWEKLLRNPLYQQLVSNLSGSQEFSSIEFLRSAVSSQKFDFIVLDTPPMQHAMDFLTSHKKLGTLFQDSIARWFESPSEGAGFLSRVFSRGTRFALDSLQKITGGAFIGQLADFFVAIRSFRGQILARILESDKILKSSTTQFLLVTGYDETKFSEAEAFVKTLRSNQYNIAGIAINRCLPDFSPEAWPQTLNSDQGNRVKLLYLSFSNYYDSRERAFIEFENRLIGTLPLVKIPDVFEEVYGIAGIKKIASYL